MLLFVLAISMSVVVTEARVDTSIVFNATAHGNATCEGSTLIAANPFGSWNVSLLAVRFSLNAVVDCNRTVGDVVASAQVQDGGGYWISGSTRGVDIGSGVGFCLDLVHDCRYPMDAVHLRTLVPPEYVSSGHGGKVFEHDFKLVWDKKTKTTVQQ